MCDKLAQLHHHHGHVVVGSPLAATERDADLPGAGQQGRLLRNDRQDWVVPRHRNPVFIGRVSGVDVAGPCGAPQAVMVEIVAAAVEGPIGSPGVALQLVLQVATVGVFVALLGGLGHRGEQHVASAFPGREKNTDRQ